MRIRYLPSAGQVGDVRLHRPLRVLAEHTGWDIDTLPVAHRELRPGNAYEHVAYDLPVWPDCDMVVFQNTTLVSGHGGGDSLRDHVNRTFEPLERAAAWKEHGCKLVVDIDDHYAAVPYWSKAYRRPPAELSALLTLVRMADLVTVTTPTLRDYYGRFTQRVRIVPNLLDWQVWGYLPSQPRRDRVRVGWYGSAGHRSGDLAVLNGVLPPILRDHDNVDVQVVGPEAERSLELLGVPPDRRVAADEVRYENLPATLDFDIGVIPLARCDFNDGKSALKGMEMNARRIPYVCSLSEPYREYTRHGRTGFYAKRGAQERYDFDSFLRRLISDETERAEMGATGRDTVRYRYTLQGGVDDWADAYAGVLDRKKVAV